MTYADFMLVCNEVLLPFIQNDLHRIFIFPVI